MSVTAPSISRLEPSPRAESKGAPPQGAATDAVRAGGRLLPRRKSKLICTATRAWRRPSAIMRCRKWSKKKQRTLQKTNPFRGLSEGPAGAIAFYHRQKPALSKKTFSAAAKRGDAHIRGMPVCPHRDVRPALPRGAAGRTSLSKKSFPTAAQRGDAHSTGGLCARIGTCAPLYATAVAY